MFEQVFVLEQVPVFKQVFKQVCVFKQVSKQVRVLKQVFEQVHVFKQVFGGSVQASVKAELFGTQTWWT